MLLSWLTPLFFVDVVVRDLGLPEGTFQIENLYRTNVTSELTAWNTALHLVHADVKPSEGKPVHVSYYAKELLKSFVSSGEEEAKENDKVSKESIIYQDLLPAFERLFESNVTFAPKLFKYVTSPHDIYILEDVRSQGFTMNSRYKRFSLEKIRLVLSKLAEFHAASAVYHSQNGVVNDDFKEGMFGESKAEETNQFLLPYHKSFVESLEARNVASDIVESIREWNQDPVNVIGKMFKYNPDQFNVLNHGDLWVFNLLFRGDELRMMDFQAAFWGNPSFDVLILLFNSLDVDDLASSFDELIELYHHELTKNLQYLKYDKPVPSLEKFKQDIADHGFVGAIQLEEIIPTDYYFGIADPSVSKLIMENTPEGEECRRELFQAKDLVAEYDKLLPFAFQRGFLKLPKA